MAKILKFLDKNYNWLIYVNLFLILLYPYNESLLTRITGYFWLCLYILAVILLFFLHFNEIKQNIHKTKYILIVLFILALMILLRNQDFPNNALATPFYALIPIPIIAILMHSKKWLRPAINLMVIFGLFHVFFTFLFMLMPNFYSTHIIPLFPEFYSELTFEFQHHQLAGLTHHYSTNASYILLTIIALYAKITYCPKPNKKKKILFICLLLVSCFALLLTGKRAHVIFLIVSAAILYLIMHKNNLKSAILTLFAMGCALIVCLILASLIFPDLAQPFVRTYKSIVDGTLFDSRMPMIDLAVAIFVNHPIFGSGWGSYKYYYQSQIVYRERDYMNAHNIYLQMLAETGIVGTIFILALFVFMFIIATKNIRQNKEKDSYIGAFLLMHCYTMLEGMVGNSIYDFQQLLPYLILAVMVLSIYIDNKRRKIYMEQSKSKSHQKILSVSVASYNLGNMIEQNIKSFVESSVADDIELIITDDGSKDDTPEIVEKYVKQYPNTVKLIKKQNEGPGSTVNSGIKNATGKYFRMVDGDDWVNTENLADYVNLLKTVDVDMVISNFDVYDNSTDKIIKTEKFKLPENTVLNFNDFHLSVPNQMHAICYKTSIFKDNNITLDNCFYTDVEFVLFPVQFVKTLIYFNKTIYVYRVAQATQSVNPNSMRKNIAQHEKVLEHLLETYSSNVTKYDEGNRDFIASRIALMANTNLNTLLLFEPSKENKARTKNFFVYLKNKNKEIYNIFKKSKKALLLNLSNFLSYNLVSKIIRKRSK